MMHKELIKYLEDLPSVEVVQNQSSWTVCFVAGGGWRFELVIPFEVLEWFVDTWAPNSQEKSWSSWSEWYSVKGGPPKRSCRVILHEM